MKVKVVLCLSVYQFSTCTVNRTTSGVYVHDNGQWTASGWQNNVTMLHTFFTLNNAKRICIIYWHSGVYRAIVCPTVHHCVIHNECVAFVTVLFIDLSQSKDKSFNNFSL